MDSMIYYCEICKFTCPNEKQWTEHVNSNKHWRAAKNIFCLCCNMKLKDEISYNKHIKKAKHLTVKVNFFKLIERELSTKKLGEPVGQMYLERAGNCLFNEYSCNLCNCQFDKSNIDSHFGGRQHRSLLKMEVDRVLCGESCSTTVTNGAKADREQTVENRTETAQLSRDPTAACQTEKILSLDYAAISPGLASSTAFLENQANASSSLSTTGSSAEADNSLGGISSDAVSDSNAMQGENTETFGDSCSEYLTFNEEDIKQYNNPCNCSDVIIGKDENHARLHCVKSDQATFFQKIERPISPSRSRFAKKDESVTSVQQLCDVRQSLANTTAAAIELNPPILSSHLSQLESGVSPITTRVIDLATGIPVKFLRVMVYALKLDGTCTLIGWGDTDEDGNALNMLCGYSWTKGFYKIVYYTGEYYRNRQISNVTFPTIQVDLYVTDINQRYKIQACISPRKYTISEESVLSNPLLLPAPEAILQSEQRLKKTEDQHETNCKNQFSINTSATSSASAPPYNSTNQQEAILITAAEPLEPTPSIGLINNHEAAYTKLALELEQKGNPVGDDFIDMSQGAKSNVKCFCTICGLWIWGGCNKKNEHLKTSLHRNNARYLLREVGFCKKICKSPKLAAKETEMVNKGNNLRPSEDKYVEIVKGSKEINQYWCVLCDCYVGRRTFQRDMHYKEERHRLKMEKRARLDNLTEAISSLTGKENFVHSDDE